MGICCYDSGNSNRGSVTTQWGGVGGVGGETEAQERGDVCIPMADPR